MGKRTGKPRGRPKGSTYEAIREKQESVQQVVALVEQVIPEAFKGDAHAFLCSVYKNPEVKMEVRLNAAAKAIHFEKPALAAISPAEEPPVEGGALNAPKMIDHDHLEHLTKRFTRGAQGLKVVNGGK